MRAVLISDKAERELREACAWWAQNRSAAEAENWYSKFVEQLLALSDNAERFALAQEAHAFSAKVYQLNFGLSGHPTHRALYIIRDEEVIILRVRHLAQQDLTESDLFDR